MLYTFDSVPSTEAMGKGNPYWDNETDSLYYVDFFDKLLFRYSLSTNTTQTLTVDGIAPPSFFIPIEGSTDKYFIGSSRSAYVVNWDGRSDQGQIDRIVFTVPANSSIDSVYTTADGALYMGTLGTDECVGEPSQGFFRYTRTKGLEEIASPFMSTVGTVIINNTLFHMDGCRQLLSALDLDPVTGALSMSCFQ